MSLASVSLMGPYLDEMLFSKYKEIQVKDEAFIKSAIFVTDNDASDDLKQFANRAAKYFIKNESAYAYGHVINDLLRRNHLNALKVNRDMLNCIQVESEYESIPDPLEEEYSKTLKQYKYFWNRNSYYAFNLANAVALLRIGGMKGFFSSDYIEEKLLEIADIVESNYSDYESFGLHVTMTTHLLKILSDDLSKYPLKCFLDNDYLWMSTECIWKFIPWTGYVKD